MTVKHESVTIEHNKRQLRGEMIREKEQFDYLPQQNRRNLFVTNYQTRTAVNTSVS
jgi:hypothetical protein